MEVFMGLLSSIGKVIGKVVDTVSPISGIIGGGITALGQKDANSAMAASTQAQMDFQERMSSTAHQREVKDLRAAGLNPILSANGGSSTPSGASYTPQNATAGGVSSALQAATVRNQIAQTNAAIKQMDAQTSQSETQADLNKAAAIKTAVDTMTSESNAKAAAINAQAAAATLPAIQAQKAYESGTTAKVLRYVNGVLSPVVNLFHGSNSAASASATYKANFE